MRSNIIGIMKHAAVLLQREADTMRECCSIDGAWDQEDMLNEIEYREMVAVADALRQNAAEIESIENSLQEEVANGNAARH